MKYRLPFLTAALTLFILSPIYAQISDRDQAIKYYLAGNYIESILALEELVRQKQYASDAELINYLGLSYQNALDAKKARKMFEKAVKLQPANAVYRANLAYSYLLDRQLNKSQQHARKAIELDPSSVSAYFVMGTADLWEGKPDDAMSLAEKMINIDQSFAAGYMLKSDVLMARLGKRLADGSSVRDEIDLLRQSVEVLETGVKNSQQQASTKGIEEKLEGMKVFYNHYSKDRTAGAPAGAVSVPESGVTRVRIISKPRAQYTDSARSALVMVRSGRLFCLGPAAGWNTFLY